MSKSKIIILMIPILSIVVLVLNLDNKKITHDNNKVIEKKAEDLNPITKNRVLKILEYEYGPELGNSEDDIKKEDNYYIIDVYLNVKSNEEHTHDKDDTSELDTSSQGTEGDIHKVNLGVHKIDIYTGDVSKVEEK